MPATERMALICRGTTDSGHRDAHVDGGTHTGAEEVLLQVDLAVGDRDHVGRDVRRDVTRLGQQYVVAGGGAVAVAWFSYVLLNGGGVSQGDGESE